MDGSQRPPPSPSLADLVSRLTTGVQDIGFAQRLAVWLRREPLTGRPDIAAAMLREIERVELAPAERARARFISELLDARAMADRSRVVELIATAEVSVGFISP